MKRRQFILTSALAVASAPLLSRFAFAKDGKIGKMDASEFQDINQEAFAKVADLDASAGALTADDQKLLLEIAMGGMMQLEASRAVVSKLTDEDVRAICNAEIEEQTGLSKKLKEIAQAKNVTLPDAPDPKVTKQVEKLQGLSGARLNHTYLQEIGVRGHELLQKTMSKVQSKAQDETLKTLAATTLPLIETHLQVSRDEMSDGGSARKA
ncbi:putative membrane protein [Catalinimonas alkaloidigena]|uniref:Putative membrane protein n=1 Tax=Catalinimonas alkaloidigena TaxID=1075417 RepID=A0A1G9AXV5_9BACT|nr:DUF4142 domain-containing protein [Catalinimonas alkaloidigena]SDK31550.1 putative membrane protein [Catalinimonas alkaloidigena]